MPLISDWPSWLQFIMALWLVGMSLGVVIAVWNTYENRRDIVSLRATVNAWGMSMVKKEFNVPDRVDGDLEQENARVRTSTDEFLERLSGQYRVDPALDYGENFARGVRREEPRSVARESSGDAGVRADSPGLDAAAPDDGGNGARVETRQWASPQDTFPGFFPREPKHQGPGFRLGDLHPVAAIRRTDWYRKALADYHGRDGADADAGGDGETDGGSAGGSPTRAD